MKRLPALALFLLSLTPQLAWAQLRGYEPKLIQVNDRVYAAVGYSLANVIYVVTDASLVVIDTSESRSVARATLAEMRKITDKPVRYIIYTHFHGDHCNGAKAFEDDKPQIIAQKLHIEEIAKYQILSAYNRRLNGLQFGWSLPPQQRAIAVAPEAEKGVIGYQQPTITFDDHYRFEEGGIKFELHHAPGETNDHLYVWLPDLKTAMCGDLYYACFPMLASPMKHERPVAGWAHSLEKIRHHKPEFLVPSHSDPISGGEQVNSVLKNYVAAIKYVNDEVIKGLNTGLSLEQLQAKIKLPPKLAELPYLRPLYGRVEWGITAAYRNYTGWYDFNPTNLNPAPRSEVHQAIVDAAGGTGGLLARSQQAFKDGNSQLVLELTEIVLAAEPANEQAHGLRARAMTKLADAAVSTVEANVYRAGAEFHRQKAGLAKTAGK